jgi:tetratricopeptide (TPR) repeat protein
MVNMSENDSNPKFITESRAAIREWQNGRLSFDEARRKLQALIHQAQKEGDAINQGNAHLTMSYLFSLRGRHEHALGWARNAERLFKQVNDSSLLSGVYITQGEIYRSLGDYARANTMFEQAYEAASEAGNEANQLFAHGNRGHVALAQNRLELARDLLEETLEMLVPFFEMETWLASPKAVHCEYQSALAETYFRLNDYEAAWKNAAQAYEIAQDLENEQGKVNTSIGALIAGAPVPEAYARFGNDFRPYFEAALAIYKAVGADLELAQACTQFADCLAANNDSSAKAQYQYAISLYSSLGMYPQARQVTQKVSNLSND